MIVIDPPAFNDPFRLGQNGEPVQVQAFFTKPAIETFDIGVLSRLARIDKVELHAVIIGPAIERTTSEFRPVINGQNIWIVAFAGNAFQHLHNARAWDRQSHIDGRAFPRAVIFQIGGPELAAIGKSIQGEVQAPPLIGGNGTPGTFAHTLGDFLGGGGARPAVLTGKAAPPLSRSP